MKYVPGPMFGQFSKSQGNTTAGHNRNGSYTRNRTIPTNPRSARQTIARGDFQALAQSWRTLTDAQRAGWTALGATMTRLDSQGQVYALTGLQAYQAVNRTLTVIGSAQVTTAPAFAAPAAIASVTPTATSV